MSDWRAVPTQRVCRRCDGEFTGKYNSSVCPDCRAQVRAAAFSRFREKNPGYWREWSANGRTRRYHLKRTYGLTEDEVRQMHAAQRGACAICGATGGWKANGGQLVVDHCHSTGLVRGLLCPSCNRGLGQFEDNPERIASAIEYLSRADDGR